MTNKRWGIRLRTAQFYPEDTLSTQYDLPHEAIPLHSILQANKPRFGCEPGVFPHNYGVMLTTDLERALLPPLTSRHTIMFEQQPAAPTADN